MVAGDVDGLAPGVYHFCPGDFSAAAAARGRLSAGRWPRPRPTTALAARAGDLVLTAIYWRNTWKYQARGYRHLFWDSGTMLANVLAVGARARPAARASSRASWTTRSTACSGSMPSKEGALVLAPLGAEGAAAPAASPLPRARRSTVIPLSAREVDYPLLREAYVDSAPRRRSRRCIDWREARGVAPSSRAARHAVAAAAAADAARPLAGRDHPGGAGPRGEFSGAAIAAEAPGRARSAHATAADRRRTCRGGLVDLYLSVHAVDGVAPGAYVYDRGRTRSS